MLFNHKLKTKFDDVYEIHDLIKKDIEESGVKSGVAIIFNPHTTAGVSMTSRMDPLGFEDLQDEVNRLIPTRIDFKHRVDTPQDAAGHIKSTIIGGSMPVIIEDGKLLIGSSQGIYFLEFDGPRNRQFYVKIMGD